LLNEERTDPDGGDERGGNTHDAEHEPRLSLATRREHVRVARSVRGRLEAEPARLRDHL
jgi:hypothetical protein